jgi:sec-independent protein translocase protein TatA
MSLGPWEIGLIFLVVLLVFGAKRIPEIARGMGKGIREFKDATADIKQELTVHDAPPRIQPPPQAQPQSYAAPQAPGQPVATPTTPAQPPSDPPPAA